MATAKYYEGTDMLAYDWAYAFPGATYTANAIWGPAHETPGGKVVYRGNFDYDTIGPTGELLGLSQGTLSAYLFYFNDIVRAKITGLNYDAVTAFLYIEKAGSGGQNGLYNVELSQELFAGEDTITGSPFDDVLAGFAGDDIISGGARQDTLVGGRGADTLTGGLGRDTFRFDGLDERRDTITDFTHGKDQFAISEKFGGGLVKEVPVTNAMFQVSHTPTAHSAEVRFIYDDNDHQLYFDVDGEGGQSAVLLANLQVGAIVTAADLVIF